MIFKILVLKKIPQFQKSCFCKIRNKKNSLFKFENQIFEKTDFEKTKMQIFEKQNLKSEFWKNRFWKNENADSWKTEFKICILKTRNRNQNSLNKYFENQNFINENFENQNFLKADL